MFGRPQIGMLPLFATVIAAGCTADSAIDRAEAPAVARAAANATNVVWVAMQTDNAALERDDESVNMDWAYSDAGDAFEGTLVGDGTWTGTIDVAGELVSSSEAVACTVDAVLSDVDLDGTVLDGEMSWGMAVTQQPDAVEVVASVTGWLGATGAVEGDGAIDLHVDMRISDAGITGSFTGTVDGEPIELDPASFPVP